MNIKMLKAAFIGLVLSVSGLTNASLVIDPSLNGGDCCDDKARGYWFASPEAFTLDSLWLNTDTGLSTSFNLDILLLNSTPPDFTSSTTDFVTLASYTNLNGVFDVNFSFSTGDIIGFLAWDNNLSTTPYADAYSATLFTSSIDLKRLVRQSLVIGDAVSGDPDQTDIGAIGFEYSATSTAVPEPSALAILALGIIGLASRRFKK